MRVTLLACLTTLLTVSGCGGRDWENELNAMTADRDVERNGRLEAEKELAESNAWANELEARGHPIYSIRLVLTVNCVPLADYDPGNIRAAGTVVTFTRQDGSTWRFVDDVSERPEINCSENGNSQIAIAYRPEDP